MGRHDSLSKTVRSYYLCIFCHLYKLHLPQNSVFVFENLHLKYRDCLEDCIAFKITLHSESNAMGTQLWYDIPLKI